MAYTAKADNRNTSKGITPQRAKRGLGDLKTKPIPGNYNKSKPMKTGNKRGG